jgi:peptidoglycan/LPS O-acetylase OafA/YrhL
MSVSRQTHLDSIRGLAAFIVIILHFFTVFFPYTSFGEKQGYIQHFEWENLFHYFPLNLLLSGRFAVCLFFVLSGYVLSYNFLGEKNCKTRIIASIIKRPIRLGGLVIFTVLIGALLWNSGLLYNQPVSQITHSIPYLSSQWEGVFNSSQFFTDFFLSPFASGTTYNPPLWTISIELYGSMLIFGIALLIGNHKYRLLMYLTLYYFLQDSFYQGFVIGILIADLDKNYKSYYINYVNSVNMSIVLLIGLIYASTPIFISSQAFSESFYSRLPDFYSLGGSYAMNGAALVFISINMLMPAKNILNKPVFRFLGHISYGLYVMHFLVIGSFSSWLFLILLNHIDYLSASLIVISISIPVIILLSYFVTLYIDKPAVILASKLDKKFQRAIADRQSTS